MQLSGEKVVLTRVTRDDLDFVCRIESDAGLWTFEESVPEDQQAIRDKFLKRIEEGSNSRSHDYIVRPIGDEKPIGLAQVWSYIDFRRSWEIGFALLPEQCGKGYGSEAAGLLLRYAFGQLGAHKVVGMCNSHNVRSAALMEKIGMTREGVFREELWWNNQWTDQYYYSILKREYVLLA